MIKVENSLKGLILGAGVVITCLVIGLGFYLSREAQNTSNSGSSQISKMNAEFQDIDKSIYDGMKISGREVIDLIKETINRDEYISIEVKNKKGNTAFYHYSHSVSVGIHTIAKSGTQDIKAVQQTLSNTYYINPSGQFMGTAYRDQNDIIICLQFIQE